MCKLTSTKFWNVSDSVCKFTQPPMRTSHVFSPSLALVAGDGEPGAADAAGAEPQHLGVPRRHAQRGRVGLCMSWNNLQ